MVALGFVGPGIPNPTTEIYNPATNTWSFADNIDFPFSRFNFHYGVLPNGKAVVAGGQFFVNQSTQGIIRDSHIYDPATNDWINTSPLNDPHGTPGGVSNSERMVILSASPWSYVADPAVCGRHCGKAFVVGQSTNGSTELFTAAGTCYGFDATVLGTEGPDMLAGTPGRDVVVGLGGDDRIAAGDGDDIICAGAGNDQISAGPGADIVLGGLGVDRVAGDDGNDWGFGEDDPDQISGGNGLDNADGGAAGDACATEATRNCP
jgi:Ca2+-binding RTX toxin-like protein